MKMKISPQTFAVTVQCSFPEEFSLEGETTHLEQKRKVRRMSVPCPQLGHAEHPQVAWAALLAHMLYTTLFNNNHLWCFSYVTGNTICTMLNHSIVYSVFKSYQLWSQLHSPVLMAINLHFEIASLGPGSYPKLALLFIHFFNFDSSDRCLLS